MMRIWSLGAVASATLALIACGNSNGGTIILNAPTTAGTQRAPLVRAGSLHQHGVLYAGILNSNPSEVLEYKFRYRILSGRITHGVALGNCCSHECNDGMLVDGFGELFVANYENDTITGYATPEYVGKKSGKLINVISSGISAPPCGLAADSKNDIFVSLGGGHYGTLVNEYAPPYKQVARQFSEACEIGWIAVNSMDDLFVQSCGEIDEFIPPRWRKHVIRNGLDEPSVFAFDDQANLFVANVGNSTITEYACCRYSGPPVMTINFGFDRVNQIFVYEGEICALNGDNGTIVCSTPPYTSTVTITNGLSNPGYAIVDQAKDLLVSNCCTHGSITIFKWPWITGNNGGNVYLEYSVDAWPIAYVSRS